MSRTLKLAIAAGAILAAVACGSTKSKKDDARNGSAEPTPSASPTALPTAAPSGAPTATPTASAEPTGTPTTELSLTDDELLAATNQYCMGCHSTTTHRHGVILDTLDGAKAAADESVGVLSSGKMPPATFPKPPDADTRAKLIEWFQAHRS
jgi:hypothetical protein